MGEPLSGHWGVPLASIDRGAGRAVLLLHGQPGHGATWTPVIDRLSDRYRLVAPDRPGYGASAGEAMGMADNADLMADDLRGRGTGPAIVVGHSWAGGIAILMAIRHPDVVRGLVLAGSVGSLDSVNGLDRLLITPGLGELLTGAALCTIGLVLPRIREAMLSGEGKTFPASASTNRRGRQYVAAMLPDKTVGDGWWGSRNRRSFLVEQRALMVELPAVAAGLGALRLPVSVVTGEWDLVVRPAAARTLASAIPGADLVTVPATGHFLARDATGELSEAIESVDRRAPG